MTIATVRRLAADLMNVGQNKVRISQDGLKEAEGALTRSDVKGLIDKGVITKLKAPGRASKRRDKRRGHGKRKGTSVSSKTLWMQKVRAQRKFLRMLITTEALKGDAKRDIYRKVKSGIFRNKKAMLLYLKDNQLVAEDYEPPKGEKPQKAEVKPEKKEPVEKEGESK